MASRSTARTCASGGGCCQRSRCSPRSSPAACRSRSLRSLPRPRRWSPKSFRRYSNDVNRLGDLERAIMEVLWQTESSLTVRQVSQGLTQRNLAHTTVMTVLDRLAKKGFARRERDGRAWRYRPAATREAYVAE